MTSKAKHAGANQNYKGCLSLLRDILEKAEKHKAELKLPEHPDEANLIKFGETKVAKYKQKRKEMERKVKMLNRRD